MSAVIEIPVLGRAFAWGASARAPGLLLVLELFLKAPWTVVMIKLRMVLTFSFSPSFIQFEFGSSGRKVCEH